MPRPLLLVGASGSAAYGEFSLARVAAAYPVVLVDTAAPTWARPYLAHHLVADLSDVDAATAAVGAFISAHDLGGMLTFADRHLAMAAYIAQALRLPSATPAALAACSDRVAVRQLLMQHRIPMVPGTQASNAKAAAVHADGLRYPVVLEPRSLPHTMRANSQGKVANAYGRASHGPTNGAQPVFPSGGVLVEQDLNEPLISAETVVLNGDDIRIAAITRTTLGPGPAQQAVRHCVQANDPLLHHPILRRIVTRAVQALSITLGVLHIEMRLTPRGPRITDIQARLADDLIPLLVQRATGIDLPRVAADLAMGIIPNLTPRRQRAAAVHFAYPDSSGRIEHLAVAGPAHDPLVDRFMLTHQTGHYVEAASHADVGDRLAHWVVLGADAANCHRTLDQAGKRLKVAIADPTTRRHAARAKATRALPAAK